MFGFGRRRQEEWDREKATAEERVHLYARIDNLQRANFLLQASLSEAHAKNHHLSDQMRNRALECASRSPGLPDEIMARAEEYLGWLRADGSPELVSEDGIAGDNPIPGFGPGEIVPVPKP